MTLWDRARLHLANPLLTLGLGILVKFRVSRLPIMYEMRGLIPLIKRESKNVSC
jgi:hypothetical protein